MRIKREIHPLSSISDLEQRKSERFVPGEVDGLKRDTIIAPGDVALVFTEPDAIDMDNVVVKYEDISCESDNADEIVVVYPSCDTLDNLQLPTNVTSTSKRGRGRPKKEKASRKSSACEKKTNLCQEGNSSEEVDTTNTSTKTTASKKVGDSYRTNIFTKTNSCRKVYAEQQCLEEIIASGRKIIKGKNINKETKNKNNSKSMDSSIVATDQTLHTCDICDYSTSHPMSMVGHMNAHKRGTDVAGSVQKKNTEPPARFTCPGHEGKSQNCNASTHPCPKCDKTFQVHQRLAQHHRCVHTNCDRYSCEECDFKTGLRYRMVAHIRTHTGEKPHCCEICNKSFGTLKSLKFHVQTVHSNGPKPHVCSICNAGFSHPQGLLRHTRSIHEGIKPFKCGYCAKAFSGKNHLNRHIALHTGDKPHVCGKCGKGYIQPGNLRYHVQRCDGDGTLPSMVQDDTPLERSSRLEVESAEAIF